VVGRPKIELPELGAEHQEVLVDLYSEHLAHLGDGSDNLADEPVATAIIETEFEHRTALPQKPPLPHNPACQKRFALKVELAGGVQRRSEIARATTYTTNPSAAVHGITKTIVIRAQPVSLAPGRLQK
jgi:hypothetical protein